MLRGQNNPFRLGLIISVIEIDALQKSCLGGLEVRRA
jgi:hypothetical protein